MRYVSTRGAAPALSFKQVLLAGLAPDGGLYVPEVYPKLDLRSLHGKSFQQIMLAVLSPYIDDIPHADVEKMVYETFTEERFGSEAITPLMWLAINRVGLLQLSNGPTMSFKDVALQLVARLMDYVLEERNETLNVLGVTSGDTGSAAADAFKGRERLRLFMLSSAGDINLPQWQNIYTSTEPNIFNLVVEHPLDGCKTLVKEVYDDTVFKERFNLGSVNSINWARIMIQIGCYVYGYLEATKGQPGVRVTFSIPSGNLGNAIAAYAAMRMGLPLNIIVATNSNNMLDRFLRTNTYRPTLGEVKTTRSPSMDIRVASNLERLVFEMVGRESKAVVDFYDAIETGRAVSLYPSAHFAPHSLHIMSGKASDAEVLETIGMVQKKYHLVIGPHAAVATKVGFETWDPKTGPLVIVETAKAAKFADTIEEALNIPMPLPEGYARPTEQLQYMHELPASAAALKGFIEQRAS